MTATAHAIIGGAIAASISDPVIGISLAFISHPLMDIVPHWDLGIGWRQKSKIKLFTQATSDLVLGVIVAYLLFGHNVPLWYFLACVLASESWDLAEIPYWFFRWNFAPWSWVYQFQHHIQGKAGLPWGIVTQVAACGLIFLALQVYHF